MTQAARAAELQRDLDEAHGFFHDARVQRKGAGGAEDEPANVQAIAAAGMSGAGGALPFLDPIQRSFGAHDVTGVKAFQDDHAARAAQGMGAAAYASGERVAFGVAPDLHTAAHEAAHVVQQRASLSLSGGVGQAGDAHEVNADRVADAVVRGESAEALLAPYATGVAASAAVQRKAAPRESLLPERFEVADKARFLLERFSHGVVTVGNGGSMQHLQSGSTLLNIRGETVFYFRGGDFRRVWFQNYTDGEIYHQDWRGFAADNQMAFLTVAAKRSAGMAKLSKYMIDFVCALVPAAGHVVLAAHVMNAADFIVSNWKDISTVFAEMGAIFDWFEQTFPDLLPDLAFALGGTLGVNMNAKAWMKVIGGLAVGIATKRGGAALVDQLGKAMLRQYASVVGKVAAWLPWHIISSRALKLDEKDFVTRTVALLIEHKVPQATARGVVEILRGNRPSIGQIAKKLHDLARAALAADRLIEKAKRQFR